MSTQPIDHEMIDLERNLQREWMLCPECGQEVHTVPAEGVDAQALRLGTCGDVFFMDMDTKPKYARYKDAMETKGGVR